MSIETKIEALITAITENTAVLREVLAASKDAPCKPTAEPKKTRAKTVAEVVETVVSQEPASTEVAPEPEPTPEPEIDLTPTPTPTPAPLKDTPHVPSRTLPSAGQPAASEHVDVDEVIGQINALVKKAILTADDDSVVKNKWAAIRKAYGVDRIADLKGNPAALLDALAKAKTL